MFIGLEWSGAGFWLGLVLWTVVTSFIIGWVRLLQDVSLDGVVFRISGAPRSVDIPVSHLHAIEEVTFSRPPSILLFFEPPTPFGRKIRVVPPWEIGGTDGFEVVTGMLRAIVANNRGVDSSFQPGKLTPECMAILAQPTLVMLPAVRSLSDEALNDVIERLPGDSELRDLARRERQERWYGR